MGATTVIGGSWYVLARLRLVSWAQVGAALKKYRQFLLFNAPYSLIGNVSRDMPIFVFSGISATQAAGFYGLARMVLMAPALLLSGALSQVFYREAVALKGSARLQTLTLALLRLGLLAAAPFSRFAPYGATRCSQCCSAPDGDRQGRLPCCSHQRRGWRFRPDGPSDCLKWPCARTCRFGSRSAQI